jgi:hypothetical protein
MTAEPTDEQLVAVPELALRGMSDYDFERTPLSQFLQDVHAAALAAVVARRRTEGEASGEEKQKATSPPLQ